MADVEWKSLPTPMWPEDPLWLTYSGSFWKYPFEGGVPTWKVQRRVEKDALPDLAASGTADSFEAAKAAALHVAEVELQSWASRPANVRGRDRKRRPVVRTIIATPFEAFVSDIDPQRSEHHSGGQQEPDREQRHGRAAHRVTDARRVVHDPTGTRRVPRPALLPPFPP